jgi:predicted PurR-regulated permease PerM
MSDGGEAANEAEGGSVQIRWSAGTWLLILALFYTAYFAKNVLIPITLAFLLNLLFAPLVRGMRRRLRIPQIVAAMVVVFCLIGGILASFYALSAPAADWMNRLPAAMTEIELKLRPFRAPVEEVRDAARKVEQLAKSEEPPDPGAPVSVVVRGPSLTETVLGQTTAISVGLLAAIVLLLFLLASGDTLLRQAISIAPRLRDKKRIVEIARDSEDDISYYLLTITMINAGLGCVIGAAMWFLNVPNPLLWGVMAAAFNYIPFVGALVGAGVIGLVSVVTFDSPFAIAAPPVVYLLLSGIEGQLITPALVARRLALNPVAVFLSLIVWSWIWGIAGALLAVPLLATFKLMCDRVESLQPIGTMLGSPTLPDAEDAN